jgi:hypothetical protein
MQADYVPGWDGLGHVAFSHAYHNNIFPHIFDNLKIWFNGMPFSHFYPPLFYFTTSFLALENNQDNFLFLFKIFNILMLIVTIVGFYFLSLKILKSKSKALLSNIIFILLISTYGRFGDLGISIESVFNYGFLPQSFSFIFFIFFLFFFNKESTLRNRIMSIITLLCIALSNIHVLLITSFYIISYFLYLLFNKDFKELKIRITDSIFASLISLFWFLPMLYYYDFSGAKSSNYGGEFYIDTYLLISIILSLISMNIAHVRKNKNIFILSIYTFLISIFNYIPITDLIVQLPLHVKRWVIVPILLIPILSIYIFGKNRLLKAVTIIALVYVSATYLQSITVQNTRGFYMTANENKFPEMIQWIINNKNDKNTLINVESSFINDVADFWYIHALLGMNNVNTTYSILRESSSMSFIFATIRNSISSDQESIGTKFNLYDQNIKGNHFISQGIDLGITHFLVKSDFSKEILSENKFVILEKKFNQWYLYKAIKTVPKISDNDLKILLTYTDFNLKKNTDNTFDLTRIAEELVWSNRLDIIFYKSDELDLSKKINYMDASGIFVAQYKYSDIEKAYDNILKMSLDRPVFLLKDLNSDLFKKIYKNLSNKNNIYFMESNEFPINSDESHNYYKNIFDFIKPKIESFKSDGFIYIRQSYFPNPKNEHKQYIATPFYILESKTEMNNDKIDIIYIAKYISIFSTIIMIIYFIYIYRKDDYNVSS